jgi:hypothetical protein
LLFLPPLLPTFASATAPTPLLRFPVASPAQSILLMIKIKSRQEKAAGEKPVVSALGCNTRRSSQDSASWQLRK